MRLQRIVPGLLGLVSAAQSIAIGKPAPDAAAETHSLDTSPHNMSVEARVASPASLLGPMLFEIMVGPYLENGVNMFQELFNFQTAQSFVDLSEESLNAIREIVSESLASSWQNRDLNKAEAFADHILGYTRGSSLIIESLIAAQQNTDGHVGDALELLSNLDDYGLQSSVVYQTVLGIYVFMQRNLITITHLLDEIYLKEDPNFVREAGTKLYAFTHYLDTPTAHLNKIQSDLRAYGNSLYRKTDTTSTQWAAGFPPSETCKHRKSRRIRVQKRESPSAGWTTIKDKKFSWIMCLSPPTTAINSEISAANSRLNSERNAWFNRNKNEALTAQFPNTLSKLNAMKSWTVAQVVESTDPELNSAKAISDLANQFRHDPKLSHLPTN